MKLKFSEHVEHQKVIGGFPLKDCGNDKGKGVIPEILNQESRVGRMITSFSKYQIIGSNSIIFYKYISYFRQQ